MSVPNGFPKIMLLDIHVYKCAQQVPNHSDVRYKVNCIKQVPNGRVVHAHVSISFR